MLRGSVKTLVEQFVANSQYPRDCAEMATPSWGHRNISASFLCASNQESEDGEDSILDLQEHTDYQVGAEWAYSSTAELQCKAMCCP